MKPARPPRRLDLAALLLAALARAAPGEEIQSLKRLSLEELLDVPITVASGLSERPSGAPWSAHVVTEETIRARGYATLLDLLEDVPQFEIQHKDSETRRNIVSVRGLFGNERLLILYDGVRVTPPSGDIYALSTQFSLRSAKRVEIVVGPMSALYGPDAFSGAINIVTKKGGELEGARLSGGGGSYGTSDVSASGGISFLRGAEFSAAAHRYASDEPFLPSRYPGDFAAAPPIPARPYEAGTGSLFFHGRLNLGLLETGYLRMDESHSSATGVKPEFSLYDKDARFLTVYDTFYAKHSFLTDDESWKLDTHAAFHSYEIDPKSRFINSFSNFRDAYKYAYDRTFEFREQVAYRLAAESSLVAGISYEDHSSLAYSSDLDRPFDTGRSAPSQGFLYPGSDVVDLNGKPLGIPVDFHYLQYQNIGAFVQLGLKQERASVTLGARFDHNTRYGDAANPRIGAVFEPVERLTLKANYGEAFVAPSPFRTHGHFGSFTPTTNGLGQITGLQSFFFTLPNPGLRPEKLREWDAGVSYRFTEAVWGNLNGYYTEVTHLIQDDVVSGPGVFKGWPVAAIANSVNRGFSRTYGGTARIDALAHAGAWSFKPNAAYTCSAGSVDGGVLAYSARHSVQAGLEAGRGKLTMYPRVIYRSRTYSATKDPQGGLQSAAPYALVNVHVRYKDIVTTPFRLSSYIGVTNLFDLRYRNAAFTAGSVGFPAVPQDPLRVAGGLELEF
ncbi:MAG: TonB-dependent receptor [Elusimicrobia bacterium]|nr:TonB-dependent receptor [Elusimicrobiota bacterium]